MLTIIQKKEDSLVKQWVEFLLVYDEQFILKKIEKELCYVEEKYKEKGIKVPDLFF